MRRPRAAGSARTRADDVQRLRVFPIDPVPDATQPRQVVKVLRCGGSALARSGSAHVLDLLKPGSIRQSSHGHTSRCRHAYLPTAAFAAVEPARGLSSRVRRGEAVSWRCAVLAGAAAWSLVGHDSAVVEDLAAPDAEWFLPVAPARHSSRRAVRAQRARGRPGHRPSRGRDRAPDTEG
jgi:hypothetical protein